MHKRFIVIVMAFLVSCSAPKYTYNFDHYDYYAGRKSSAAPPGDYVVDDVLVQKEDVVASNAITTPAVENQNSFIPAERRLVVKPEGHSFAKTKVERKEIREKLKRELKNYKRDNANSEDDSIRSKWSKMERGLKLAIIFGAVGLILALLGGLSEVLLILGMTLIVVGVVFLIRWLVKQ